MKTLRFLSALLLLCFLPIRVLAMDTELVYNSAEWCNRADTNFLDFKDDEVLSKKLRGYRMYYLDFSEHCFYINLSYETLNVNIDNSSNIFLHFNIKNSSNEYAFNIDKNGFYESDENAMKAFKAEPNFGNIQNNGQMLYAGIEFLNKEDKKLNNTIEITLNIINADRSVYKILEVIPLNYGDYAASLTTAKPTTTKHTATKPSTEAKTTTGKTTEKSTEKQTATKATTETPGAEKTTKTKPESTTKFKYIPTTGVAEASTAASTSAADSAVASASTSAVASSAATENHSNSPIDGGTAFVYENTTENKNGHGESTTATEEQTHIAPTENSPSQSGDIIIPEAQNAGSLSPQAKLLAALAIVFAVLGTALIIRGLPKKEKVDENDNNEEKDE